jgi:oligoribonuclease NrnB/cAMP/cGMP phosphodiesterase (DHH superfamily)
MNTYTPGSKKPLVIYHANCADGFSAAWVFWQEFGTIYEYFPGIYGKPAPDVAGRMVYLVDFSYKRHVVEEMLKTAEHVWLIDHHKTAIDDLETLEAPNFNKFTSLDMSGATLAWDFVYGVGSRDSRPLLLGHVEDRDLWRFKLPLTREIQANLFSYEYSMELWSKLMDMTALELTNFAAAGSAIERKHFKDIKELLSVSKHYRIIGDCRVPVACLPYTMSSDAANIMAAEWQEGTLFAGCYYDTPTGRAYSLRSLDRGLDVSAIAGSYGGGGHRNAAGFTVPHSHKLAGAPE